MSSHNPASGFCAFLAIFFIITGLIVGIINTIIMYNHIEAPMIMWVLVITTWCCTVFYGIFMVLASILKD